ncbi:MAG: hypothetical protein IJ153_03555 [Clostridia bacterium]|nr:hypothetical protein [Clostridia bacterium]
MFGKEKIKALEDQLSSARKKMEDTLKDKTTLTEELSSTREELQAARERIKSLEEQIAQSESAELKEQARQTIVEYEGLKELYQQKNQEIDATREDIEEGFAREAATKRQDLADEIAQKEEDNRQMIAETVSTFAGSYRYYLDQIRVLMDALSQAAQETGDTLFKAEQQNIQESFGVRIVERLRSDADTLRKSDGDKLLIGAEEAKATIEEAVEDALQDVVEEVAEAVEETVAEEISEDQND